MNKCAVCGIEIPVGSNRKYCDVHRDNQNKKIINIKEVKEYLKKLDLERERELKRQLKAEEEYRKNEELKKQFLLDNYEFSIVLNNIDFESHRLHLKRDMLEKEKEILYKQSQKLRDKYIKLFNEEFKKWKDKKELK